MEQQKHRGPGRPKSEHRAHAMTLRLSDADESFLASLALEWDCSRSDVIRRLLTATRVALAEAGEREGD